MNWKPRSRRCEWTTTESIIASTSSARFGSRQLLAAQYDNSAIPFRSNVTILMFDSETRE